MSLRKVLYQKSARLVLMKRKLTSLYLRWPKEMETREYTLKKRKVRKTGDAGNFDEKLKVVTENEVCG